MKHVRAPWQRLLSLLLLYSAFGGGTLSCGDNPTGPRAPSSSQAYWALQLNQHAVQLALVPHYNTVQLTATPLNPAGAPLSNVGSVTYTATDSTVTVSPTGLVTAHFITQPGTSTRVVAALQTQNVTLTDTVRIQITDTVPQHPLATFSIHPVQGDSAKRSLDTRQANGNFGFSWSVRATDALGTTVCSTAACALQVYYTSSNPTVAIIDSTGLVGPQDTGRTVFTATTLAYGVVKRDSVAFTVGYQLHYNIFMALSLLAGVLTLGFKAPKVLILGVGATVTFCNNNQGGPYNGRPANVIFDDSTLVDSASSVDQVHGIIYPPTGRGNIAPFACDTNPDGSCQNDSNVARSRRFPVAGTYHYHSTLFPSDTFTIIIKSDR